MLLVVIFIILLVLLLVVGPLLNPITHFGAGIHWMALDFHVMNDFVFHIVEDEAMVWRLDLCISDGQPLFGDGIVECEVLCAISGEMEIWSLLIDENDKCGEWGGCCQKVLNEMK